MSNSWKWKFYSVMASFVIGIYLLVPTIFGFDTKREALLANGQPVPWHLKLFPKKALNLGLDLRGGIYVEMQVNLSDAIKRKTDLFAGDLERSLKDQKVTPVL